MNFRRKESMPLLRVAKQLGQAQQQQKKPKGQKCNRLLHDSETKYCHLQQCLASSVARVFCHTLSRTRDKSWAFKEFNGIQLGNLIQNPLDTVCS